MAERHYPKADSREALAANFADIKRRIDAACASAGRDPSSVRLLPVSKTVDAAIIREAYELGYRCFGENKVQEAWDKYNTMNDLPIEWSVIGHLQTNKIKYVARFASEFQALDSLRVAEKLNERLGAEGRTLDVLVQVNTSGEESKYGLAPSDTHDFVQQLAPYKNLNVKGLMTLALLSNNSEKVRDCFVLLRQLRDELRHDLPTGMTMDELSMGMSGDFEMAIAEGATIVRIGQAIFGARDLPDSHYWPEQK